MSYNENDSSMYDNGSSLSEEEIEKQLENQSTAKALEVTAKGVATAYGSPLAGKAVDLATKTKTGQKILNKGGEVLNKIPGMGKTTKALSDSGITDMASDVVDVAGKNKKIPNSKMNTNIGKKNNISTPTNKTEIKNSTPPPKTPPPPPQNDKDDNSKRTSKITIMLIVKVLLILLLPIFLILLVIMLISTMITTLFGDFSHAFGSSYNTNGETGNIEYNSRDKNEQDFYERLKRLKQDFLQEGKDLDVVKVSAVYHVMNKYNNKYNYDYMTYTRLKEIANSMFKENIYDSTLFKNNLINIIFKKYFPKESLKIRSKYAEEVFKYFNDYFELIGDYSNTCNFDTSCSYNLKGFNLPGKGNVRKKIDTNNIQVRIMKCNENEPINSVMIPFENYVAGVTYAEIGDNVPLEAIKSQMIVARNYALSKSVLASKPNLKKENGVWVLEITACNKDQAYCNIDEGCTLIKENNTKIKKSPLDKNNVLRIASNATAGELLVDNNEYIIATNYTIEEKRKFISLANQGLDYKQILLEVYNNAEKNYNAANINKMVCKKPSNLNCGNASTGPYSTWKQYEGPWINTPIGTSGSTLKDIGCLATSISILIAKSGTQTVVNPLNPGTFVEYLNKEGGFASSGDISWNHATLVAPNFKYSGMISLKGQTKNQKFNTIKNLIRENAYIVAEVKGDTGQHWVAIDTISENSIIMMDPGSTSTNMWSEYNWKNTSTIAYYFVK